MDKCNEFSLPPSQEHVTVAEDLRICAVKLGEDMDRRFCFEVVTPQRSAMLQADSEALRRKWLAYLEAGIARALRISASNKVGCGLSHMTPCLGHMTFNYGLSAKVIVQLTPKTSQVFLSPCRRKKTLLSSTEGLWR